MQPATTAVLVNDMRNDNIRPDGAFAATGAAEHAASQNVIGNVRAVLDAARTAVIPVFHNVIVGPESLKAGSWGAAMATAPNPPRRRDRARTHPLSAFHGT